MSKDTIFIKKLLNTEGLCY